MSRTGQWIMQFENDNLALVDELSAIEYKKCTSFFWISCFLAKYLAFRTACNMKNKYSLFTQISKPKIFYSGTFSTKIHAPFHIEFFVGRPPALPCFFKKNQLQLLQNLLEELTHLQSIINSLNKKLTMKNLVQIFTLLLLYFEGHEFAGHPGKSFYNFHSI